MAREIKRLFVRQSLNYYIFEEAIALERNRFLRLETEIIKWLYYPFN